MIKTILIPVLVGSFALCVHASDDSYAVAGRMVPSSQDFQSATGENIHLEKENEQYYWNSPEDVSMVSTDVGVADGVHYLKVDASDHPDEGLQRLMVPRNALFEPVTAASTSMPGAGGYDGYYLKFKSTFPTFDADSRPEIDGRDRLVFWSRGGALFVTAGRFVGSARHVEAHDYRLVASGFSADDLHEVVLRVIPDIQTGAGALGFELWIDGSRKTVDGPIQDGSLSPSVLTPEARVLIAQNRLFPSLSVPGVNESVALGGVAFTGSGAVDDFAYSFAAPDDSMKAPNVFMLRWDAGVKSLSYRINGGASVNVGSIGDRSAVFEIPAGATVGVTATYESGCSEGVWRAESSCTLSGTSFAADASAALGVGYVGSAYSNISLGGVGVFMSFAEAKEAAIAAGKDISLSGDFMVSADTLDAGRIFIDKGETVTIDLNGHTLGTTCGEFPTIVNCGTLVIRDSVGGGVVKAYSEFSGDVLDSRQIAVQNYASLNNVPSLTIAGGVYDGRVNNSGVVIDIATVARRRGELRVVRNGTTDEPKFISADAEEFEFGEDLEDPKLYYVYSEPYWQPAEGDAFIWCGKGADGKWSTAANWRCNAVPGADDYAYFPSRGTNAWEVTVADGDEIGDVMFVGNVNLHGSADFSAAVWRQPADGRVSGDAEISWNGKLPPDLTATLLADDWAGTVAIVDVGDASPKLMSDMAGWGTATSKVRFEGVRGYYHKTSNLTVPWTLVLEDGANGYAWKNDAGFTGGVIEFPVLLGNGRFVSPKNTIANRQVIVFRDAYAYGGVLEVYGKRVVIGPGEVGTMEAGSITWSDGAQVKNKSVPDECRVAAFGGTMEFFGNWGAVLAKYSDFTVDDSAEVVTLVPGDLTAELCVDQPVGEVRIARWSENAVIVDGRRVVISGEEPVGGLNSQSSFSAPGESPALKRLSAAAAGYYTPTLETKGELTTLTFALNELAVPVIGNSGDESAKMKFEDGLASIVISDVIKGFWYGLEYKSSLAEDWSRPEIWEVAAEDGGKVGLVAPAEGTSGFYRVVVSDVKPEEGDAE